MKNLFYGIVILGVLVFVSGCTGKEKTISCTLHRKDVVNDYEINATYKIYAKGSDVFKVETKEEVTSEDEDVIDYFEDTLETTYKKASSVYGGYSYKVDKSEGKIVSDVTIDYNKMDLEQYVKDTPALKNFMKNGKLSTDGLVSVYEAMGATCK